MATDSVQALIYLSYSKEMATISDDLVGATMGGKYQVGQSEVQIERFYERIIRMDTKQQLLDEFILLLSGTLLGVGITIFIIERKTKKK